MESFPRGIFPMGANPQIRTTLYNLRRRGSRLRPIDGGMAAAATAANQVTLTSSDGQKFVVDEEVAMESQTIKHGIEDVCADTDFPLPNVTGKILAKVIEYCKKPVEVRKQADEEIKTCDADFIKHMIEDGCADTDIPLPTGKILAKVIEWRKKRVEVEKQADEEIKTWKADFVKVDQATLFDLILAANYLDIKSLLDLTCQTVADMVKGKNPEEIRKTFNIKSEFTPEEEEEVRREDQWAFE